MREIKNINSNWLYSDTAASAPSTLPTDWEELNLPHTWNGVDGQDGGNDYVREKHFYCKEIPKDDLTGEENYLEFDAVNSSAEVFWNGVSLCVHHGGYSRFRVKIPNDSINAVNILAVSADNSPNETVYPQVADFTFYGGIYRSVKIICVNKSHFDLDYFGAPGIQVTPKVNGTDADIHIKTYLTDGENAEVSYKILDGETVVAETVSESEVTLTVKNVHLWNGVKDPHLYKAVATLIVDGTEVDEISTRFGVREFKVDPEKGFILNGTVTPLRGVSRHQDNPTVGNALTYEEHKRDIDLICELGANTVRLAHYQHAQEFYDLCDERGLCVWAEIPYISKHMPTGFDNTVSQMTELIAQNYNHPSIITWGLSNEITINGASDQSLIDNHKYLNDLCHKMDSTRPTTLAAVTMCGIDEEVIHISDILSYNHYFGWYGGNTDMNGPWFDKFHKKYPNRAIGLSEYGCEALNWHTSEPAQGDYTEEYQSYYHEELIKQIDARPYLWATHVWNMFDFAADAREEGGEAGQNHKGLVTFDRQYKKDSFYAYQAWLSDKPMLHICSKRYIDRVEDVTKVTVYSNCPEVELYANGELVEKQQKGQYPFFYFNVKNTGETTIVAKAGDLKDESHIKKVDEFNKDYIMKDANSVINWFDITTPAGYLSINDTLGEILSTFKGKLFAIGVVRQLMKTMKNNKPESEEKPKEKKEKAPKKKGSGLQVMGFSLNKDMLEMAKGFSLKRAVMMTGNLFPADMVIEMNKKLNKIKKKSK
ncbi:MAG: glycoside hydrolase family 2 TIM barrel-domain containing protein [Acutalibacteraceae bacterium]